MANFPITIHCIHLHTYTRQHNKITKMSSDVMYLLFMLLVSLTTYTTHYCCCEFFLGPHFLHYIWRKIYLGIRNLHLYNEYMLDNNNKNEEKKLYTGVLFSTSHLDIYFTAAVMLLLQLLFLLILVQNKMFSILIMYVNLCLSILCIVLHE